MLNEEEIIHDISIIDLKIRKIQEKFHSFEQIESRINNKLKEQYPDKEIKVKIFNNGMNPCNAQLKKLLIEKDVYYRILHNVRLNQ